MKNFDRIWTRDPSIRKLMLYVPNHGDLLISFAFISYLKNTEVMIITISCFNIRFQLTSFRYDLLSLNCMKILFFKNSFMIEMDLRILFISNKFFFSVEKRSLIFYEKILITSLSKINFIHFSLIFLIVSS